jgi:riboflavin kinase/FMN adenylyltransferase
LQVFRGAAALPHPPRRAVLTIGNFDGLHVGHRQILRTVTERANALGGESVVYTFDPHPRKVLQPDRAPSMLTTTEQKLELLEAAGIAIVVLEPFTPAFATTTPDTFVRENLHARIAPLEVYVGYDFHYGRDRAGSMRLLTELGPRLGFAVTIIPEVTVDGADVSSSRIRELVAVGEVEQAARLLGRPFALRGAVVAGDRRGRTIGFPTLNLAAENEVLPALGVYAGHVRLLDGAGVGAWLAAVINVGRRPTFKADDPPLAEAHLIDFEGDLYGRRVEIAFEARLREERRFPSVEALREQIARDVEVGRRLLAAGAA